jgi:choline dehydrogenase-like flavoprotein
MDLAEVLFAVGVEFSRGDGTERAEAAREVILSAGAIGSPHLCRFPESAIPGISAGSASR